MQKLMQTSTDNFEPRIVLKKYIIDKVWEVLSLYSGVYNLSISKEEKITLTLDPSIYNEDDHNIFYNLNLLKSNPHLFQTQCKDDKLKEYLQLAKTDIETINNIYLRSFFTHRLFALCKQYRYRIMDIDIAYVNSVVKYAYVNYADVYGNTALHYAAQFLKDMLAKALLMRGAKVAAENKKGELPYDLIKWKSADAAMRNILTVILAAEDPQQQHRMSINEPYIFTPLGESLRFGLTAAVKKQLDKGADPNKAIQTSSPISSLTYILKKHKLFTKNVITDISLALIEHGVELKPPTEYHQGCLQLAAQHGFYEVCKSILNKRPTLIDSVDKGGYTALYYAARYATHFADLNFMKLFLSYSPAISSLSYILENHKMFAKNVIEIIILALINTNADLNTLCKNGVGCLQLATHFGLNEVCKTILEKNLQSITSVNKGKRTVLYYAVRSDDANLDLLSLLLSYTVKVLEPSDLEKELFTLFFHVKKPEKVNLIKSELMKVRSEHNNHQTAKDIASDDNSIPSMLKTF